MDYFVIFFKENVLYYDINFTIWVPDLDYSNPYLYVITSIILSFIIGIVVIRSYKNIFVGKDCPPVLVILIFAPIWVPVFILCYSLYLACEITQHSIVGK